MEGTVCRQEMEQQHLDHQLGQQSRAIATILGSPRRTVCQRSINRLHNTLLLFGLVMRFKSLQVRLRMKTARM